MTSLIGHACLDTAADGRRRSVALATERDGDTAAAATAAA